MICKRNIFWKGVSIVNQSNSIKYSAFTGGPTNNEENTHGQEYIRSKIDRNRSKLLGQHRNVLFNVVPYLQACSWIHLTEKYKRKVFGRHGLTSGVDPYICFNMHGQSDTIDKVKEGCSLQKLVLSCRDNNLLKTKAIESRELEIASKLEKLEQWKLEMRNRISKKEADALAAKEHKRRLIEEVRRHFGFKVDPRDERFKEMLEQKEREERKKQKEAKRKAKEDKMMAKLANNTSPYRG
ncbi:growth arrest and DNA damage-inducible proteins-interacting protein 1 [Anastrepha obliqua]|uniref:growth arrest and DNA damage-inducible proteins-interacting protein 1 n=1 Tax=Anastrepha obliqua TaxID=95512 RepID=UPI002409BF62|nr:growth arrest and DNA damage-inducible proteins-interacting protein 1 [Anastrepha obliqua]